MKNCRGWSDHFIELQSNLFLRTPLYYGQFVCSQKCQKSYVLYLYNTDIPLVSVLKRFDCIFQVASDLIHAIWKSIFEFRISQWNENSSSQTPRKFTQTQRRILLKKIHLGPRLQSKDYGTKFFWISCLNPNYPIEGTLSLFQYRSTNGHFLSSRWTDSVLFYNGHLTLYGEAPPRGPTPYLITTIFYEKSTPFVHLLLTNGTPFTYLL